jgi:hypothetical protein
MEPSSNFSLKRSLLTTMLIDLFLQMNLSMKMTKMFSKMLLCIIQLAKEKTSNKRNYLSQLRSLTFQSLTLKIAETQE